MTALVASAEGVANTSASPIDTTGANLIIISIGYGVGAPMPASLDNKGNSYVALGEGQGYNVARSRLFYCFNPTVGPGHVFYAGESFDFVGAIAFSGATSAPFDRQDVPTGIPLGTSYSPGPIATTQDNEIIVTGLAVGKSAGNFAINAGFTIAQSRAGVENVSWGGAIAYQIQGARSNPSPTWSWSQNTDNASSFAVFKGTAAASVPPTNSSPPTVNGAAYVGNKLSAGNGTWSNGPTGFSYQWNRDGVPISGATSSSYTVGSGDLGAVLSVTVTARNASGPSAAVTSANTAAVINQSIVAASVATVGCQVQFKLAAAATTLDAASVSLVVNGYPMACTAITGSGTDWTVTTGMRWITKGSTVTVAIPGAAAAAAANNSLITTEMIRHVGRRFGMFVHFGINTFNNAEWSDGGFPANSFAPTGDIAAGIDSWIAAAKMAGMKYLVLTAKHHDGFALWPDAEGGYNISNSSWWVSAGSPDIVSIFCQKVRAAGLGVGLYFSIWDRRWEAQNPGYTGAAYTAHCQAHLTDLLTKYGPIDLVWLDGWILVGTPSLGQVNFDTVTYAPIRSTIKTLQPDCLMVVNTHDTTLDYTDIVGYEIGSTTGSGAVSGNLLPAETCDTIRVDNNWFWHSAADPLLSPAEIASMLATQNSYRSAFLLNIPPDTSGAIPQSTLATLAQMAAINLEEGRGASKFSGSMSLRTVTLALTSDGTTPTPNLTGLKCALYENANPLLHERPIAQWIGSTNGAGVLTKTLYTRAAAGQRLWLVVTNSDGTTSQSPMYGYSGPVQVS